MKLPLCPARNPGEGSAGYLLRLAEANGYSGPHQLAREAGSTWTRFAAGLEIDLLARMTAGDPVGIASDTGQPLGGQVALRGERVGRRHWSVTSGRRLCPQCLADDESGWTGALPRAWQRSWWEIRPVTTCLRHGTRLRDRCACGERLSFADRAVDLCRCGCSPVTDTGDLVDVDRCRGDRYVLGRIGAVERVPSQVLDAMDLGDAIALLNVVGSILTTGAKVEPHEVLDKGFGAFLHWPDSFHEALDEVVLISKDAGRWGAENAYGPLVELARRMPPSSGSKDVRLEIARHAAAHSISRADKPVLGMRVPRSTVTLAGAQELLGVGVGKMKRMARGANADLARIQRGVPASIDLNTVFDLKRSLDSTIDLARAGAALGIGKVQARSLVEAGLLPVVGDRVREGLAEHRIDRDEPEKLVEKLLWNPEPQLARSLPGACRAARTSLVVACRAILDGHLRTTTIEGVAGLARVGVNVSALRRIGRTARSEGLTVAEASDRLGEKWQVVRDLVRQGLLMPDASGRIDRRSVETFQSVYEAGSAIARRARVAPKSLMRIASEAGIQPAIAPPSGRKAFYSMADARRIEKTLKASAH